MAQLKPAIHIIIASLCILIVIAACNKDNFPTYVAETPMQNYNGKYLIADSCTVIVDSIKGFGTDLSSNSLSWYGRIKNKSTIALSGSLLCMAKIYTDSTKTVIYKNATTYINLYKFLPGEFQYFQMEIYVSDYARTLLRADSVIISNP